MVWRSTPSSSWDTSLDSIWYWLFFISARMEYSCLLSASSWEIFSLQWMWGEEDLLEVGGWDLHLV